MYFTRNSSIFLTIITILALPFVGFANSAYTEVDNCAAAKVVSGDTCSNAKVEFTFDKCEKKLATMRVSRMICDRDTIKARATVDGYRVEARYKKQDDGWGSVTWEPMGVKMYAPSNAVGKEVSKSEESVQIEKSTPAPETAERVASSETPASLSVSGFLDVRHTARNSDNPAAPLHNETGFLFEDAALYFGLAKGNLTLTVDLPFSRSSDGETTGPNFSFAQGKAQANGKLQFTDKFAFTIGQFDTLFGLELNDAKDRIFGEVGLVYAQTLPVVHSGMILEYKMNDFTAKLLVANPADRGSLADSGTKDNHHEYGLTLGYASGPFRSQLGYLTRSKENLAGESDSRSLIDLVVGATIGPVDVDAQYSIVDDPRKDTLSTDAADDEDAGSGLAVIVAYKVIENLKLGVRYEMIQDDPGSVGFDEADSAGVAVHYMAHENMTLRAEYTQFNAEPTLKEPILEAGAKHNAYDRYVSSIGALFLF